MCHFIKCFSRINILFLLLLSLRKYPKLELFSFDNNVSIHSIVHFKKWTLLNIILLMLSLRFHGIIYLFICKYPKLALFFIDNASLWSKLYYQLLDPFDTPTYQFMYVFDMYDTVFNTKFRSVSMPNKKIYIKAFS